MSLKLALIGLLLWSGCKPAEEPPRQAGRDAASVLALDIGRPDGVVRVTERITSANPTVAAVGSTAPPVIGSVIAPSREEVTASNDTGADEGGAELDAGGEEDEVTKLAVTASELSDELIAELAVDPGANGLREARRLNKLGLDAHRDLQLDVAKEHYLAALDAAASYPFARYNLACAYALEKKNDDALFHLAVIAHLARTEQVARDRLAAARIDADFELLRDDPRFRALTGATGMAVTWAAGADSGASRKEARRLVKLLRAERWYASLADLPWQQPVAGSIIRVAGEDPIAESAAKTAAELLLDASNDASPRSWPIEIGAPLPPGSPPILVIVAPPRGDGDELVTTPSPSPSPYRSDPEGSPRLPAADHGRPSGPAATRGSDLPAEPPPPEEPLSSISDALNRTLRATRGDERHRLELKSTGFFRWVIRDRDGVRRTRTGRWAGSQTIVVLRVTKETTERPSPDKPEEVDISVEEGLARDHQATFSDGGISVGGLQFK